MRNQGLRYQLYKNRYAELTKRTANEVESLSTHANTSTTATESIQVPDWEGFQG